MRRSLPTLAWYLAFAWLLLRSGDRLGLPLWATTVPAPPWVAQRPQPARTDPFELLWDATVLRSARVGAAATLSAEGRAWWSLAQGPTPADAFRRLAESENPVAALYGLIWLKAHQPNAYWQRAIEVRSLGWRVTQMRGCVVEDSIRVSAVLDAIEAGEWLELAQDAGPVS